MEIRVPLNPHCDQQLATNTKPITRRLKSITTVRYVYACIHVDLSQTRFTAPTNVSSIRLCFAVRRALDNAVLELFGQLSGTPLLQYDVLLCRPVIKGYSTEFTCSILLSIVEAHLCQMLTVLGLLSTDVGGYELLSLFPDQVVSQRDNIITYVEVISVHESLFAVNLDLDS
ncbi:unnamed protein product [Echinostoma caproni]|uniref:Ribonuclease P n=1 Tax=Echinostoma caproni TaxID=27848 RepID=A0A183A8R1_9TREM|nr:unnamed protein product [Echinostoma caproni]